jgi:hypothetical protein
LKERKFRTVFDPLPFQDKDGPNFELDGLSIQQIELINTKKKSKNLNLLHVKKDRVKGKLKTNNEIIIITKQQMTKQNQE